MSKAILLSIHPKWAEKIYSGEKRVEWRKNAPSNPFIDQIPIFLYETAPVKKITGLIYVDRIKRYSIGGVGGPVYTWGCVPYEDLEKYAGDKDLFAWMIRGSWIMKIYNGKEFLTLADFGLKRPPQSWQYVEVKE